MSNKKRVPWTTANQHSKYDMAEWRRAVGAEETLLGYDAWVEHNLEADRHDQRMVRAEITVVYPVTFTMRIPANTSLDQIPPDLEDKIKNKADSEFREGAEIHKIHFLN